MAKRSQLAVILHADVVGSTTLVQLDDRVAHERIQQAFHCLADTVARYYGKTHELRGDALIAQFHRGSDAISGALAFQYANSEKNAELADDIRPRLRIGVALGEVIIADETLTGAGVVLAQRLEQLADPDGIVVQGAVYETIPRRLPFEYDFLGERSLKGFDEPFRAYAVTVRGREDIPSPEEPTGAPKAKAEAEGATASENNAIAVLPFVNLSKDPDQEYFSDGLTEDVITALSYYRAFPVIARNSSFTYKGVSARVQEVAQALGARYVLEGSVRKAGNRIRVSAQLIDGGSGHHLWAEKYDRSLEDIFDLQDELTQKITATVQPELDRAELDRAVARTPDNLRAWDYFLRGMAHLNRFTRDDVVTAREMFQRAIELEPTYGEAWAGVGWSYVRDMFHISPEERPLQQEKALDAARKAVRYNETSVIAHFVLGSVFIWTEELQRSIAQFKQCLQINPFFAPAIMALGNALDHLGHVDEGVEQMKKSLELNPRDPLRPTYMGYLARAYTSTGDHEQAISWIEQAVNLRPDDPDLRYRHAVCLANADKVDEATVAIAKSEALQPGFVLERRCWRPYADDDRNAAFYSGLVKHGFIGDAKPV